MSRFSVVLLSFLLTFFTLNTFAGTPARITRIASGWGSSPAPLPYSKNYYQQWTNNSRNQARFMTYAVPKSAAGGVATIAKPRPLVAVMTPQSLSKAIAKRARMGTAFLPPPLKLALLVAGLAETACEISELCWKSDYKEGDPTMQRYPARPKTKTLFTCHYGSTASPAVTTVGTVNPVTTEELTKMRQECAPAVAGVVAQNCPAAKQCGGGAPTYVFTPTGARVSMTYTVYSNQSTCSGTPSSRTCSADVAITNAGTTLEYSCPPDTTTLGNVPRIMEYSKVLGTFCVLPWYPVPVTPEVVLPSVKSGPLPDFDPADLTNADGTPDPDLFENPEFPDGVSDDFYDAVDSIINGTAQTSDPSAPNYMTTNTYNNTVTQINNWLDNRTWYDPFNGTEHVPAQPTTTPTPTDPAPGQMSWDDFPGITQSQYEQSNNSWASSVDQTKNAETAELQTDAEKDNFINSISDLPDNPIDLDLIDYIILPTSGTCIGFTVYGSAGGVSIPITVDKHCPPYEAWGRPVVSWFISMITILQIFHIFRRTIEVI